MKKTITFIIFAFLLYVGKSQAVNNDSTVYAKDCFQKAKTEIENMLSGKIPLNYERAVFLTENAFWGNVFSDSLFSDLIDFHSQNIKILAESNRTKKEEDFKSDFVSTKEQKQKYYDNALYNWAIFKYLTDTTMFLFNSRFYVQMPLQYSTKDPLGTMHWENSQVLNLLDPEKNTGNCMAMTSLFKIFSERLNTDAKIGTAPGHVFIIHNDEKDIEYNVELATHSFPGAGSLMTLTYTSDKALRSGIAMRTLDTKQSVGLCLVYLAKGYEHKFNIKNSDFMLQCAETALQYDSLNLNAMLLKAEVLEARLIEENKTVLQLQNDSLFLQYQNLLSSLLEKGYYEMPSEMKDIILSKLRNENIGYFATNHTPQPFQNIGVKEERYATLSWGLFDENPQPMEIERYGKTLFDTETKKIIEFKEPDSTFSNYPLDPVVFAWSIDPLRMRYPNVSPYVAFADNPLLYIDKTGKIIDPFWERDESGHLTHFTSEDALNTFTKSVNSLFDEIPIFDQIVKQLKDSPKIYSVKEYDAGNLNGIGYPKYSPTENKIKLWDGNWDQWDILEESFHAAQDDYYSRQNNGNGIARSKLQNEVEAKVLNYYYGVYDASIENQTYTGVNTYLDKIKNGEKIDSKTQNEYNTDLRRMATDIKNYYKKHTTFDESDNNNNPELMDVSGATKYLEGLIKSENSTKQ